MTIEPRDLAVRWAPTLVEPLLDLGYRVELERALESLVETHPDWFASFGGGVLSDMVATLPASDPWRSLSARLGSMTVGHAPPAQDGARKADGRAFGGLADHLDIIGAVFPDPVKDAALAAVAHPIHPRAIAVIGFAGHGWREAQNAVGMLVSMSNPTEPPPPPLPSGRLRLVTSVPAADPSWPGVYRCWLDALRWVIHRRRAYGVGIEADPWPTESVYRWSWRADRIADGDDWPIDQIAAGIAMHQIIPRLGE